MTYYVTLDDSNVIIIEEMTTSSELLEGQS